MSIHTRIKQKRLECGFSSHQALAHEVGVSWQTVQLWEKEGGTAPNRNRIKKVAEVLGTTPEWLMNGSGEETAPSAAAARSERTTFTLQWVSEDEAELLSAYRAKTDGGKNTMLVMAEALPNADHANGADHKAQ